jgi:hypothetical protein
LKAKLRLVVSAMVVMLVAACGSSASPQQKAQSAATAACSQLLEMGSAIMSGNSVTTAAALKTLNSASNSANKAAQLDQQKWGVLAGTVRDIVKYLESGPRGALPGTLDDLAVYCKPLVQPGTN